MISGRERRWSALYQRLFIPAPTLPSTGSPAQQTPSTIPVSVTSVSVLGGHPSQSVFWDTTQQPLSASLFQTGVELNQDVGSFLTELSGGGQVGLCWSACSNDEQCQPEELMR